MKHFLLLWKLLNKNQKIYFFYIVFLMLSQALLEILSIALVIPFTALILDPTKKTDLSPVIYLAIMITVFFIAL